MLKCHVKAFSSEVAYSRMKSPPDVKFRRYGVRIAIGIGSLRTNDIKQGIIDGEAIYRSGRALDGMSSRMPTIVMAGNSARNERIIQAVLNLANELLSHATAKQCQVCYMRLCAQSENEIAASLQVTQQAVNVHLRKAGWYAIENALEAFEEGA